MMKWLRRAMATRSASNSASASRLSTCLVRDTLCCWSSPRPLPAPSPILSALAQYLADWHQPAPAVRHDQHEEHSKRCRRHHEEIQCDKTRGVILQERSPRL